MGDDLVAQYVAPSGALSPKTPATVVASSAPEGVTVSPDGSSVYVADNGIIKISQYSVGANGALSPETPATQDTPNGPKAVAVSPDGRSVYSANAADGTVSQYQVGPGGILSSGVKVATDPANALRPLSRRHSPSARTGAASMSPTTVQQ